MNKLCCILDVYARCPMCDFVTCAECTADGLDTHTIGSATQDGDTDLWWFCTPTQTPIAWERMEIPLLVVSKDDFHPYVRMMDMRHMDAAHEEALLVDAKR